MAPIAIHIPPKSILSDANEKCPAIATRITLFIIGVLILLLISIAIIGTLCNCACNGCRSKSSGSRIERNRLKKKNPAQPQILPTSIVQPQPAPVPEVLHIGTGFAIAIIPQPGVQNAQENINAFTADYKLDLNMPNKAKWVDQTIHTDQYFTIDVSAAPWAVGRAMEFINSFQRRTNSMHLRRPRGGPPHAASVARSNAHVRYDPRVMGTRSSRGSKRALRYDQRYDPRVMAEPAPSQVNGPEILMGSDREALDSLVNAVAIRG